MATKMTKKDYYNQLLAIADVQACDSLVDFINHELELLAKKNAGGAKGMTPTQKQNEELKGHILDFMEPSTVYTATDIHKGLDEHMDGFQIQKTSALLKQLVDSGKVTKTIDKKKTFFTLA